MSDIIPVQINRIKLAYNIREKEIIRYLMSNIPNINPYIYLDAVAKCFYNVEHLTVKTANSINCPVCMENTNVYSLCSTRCGHHFCIKCLLTSCVIKKSCPLCRNSIDISDKKIVTYIDMPYTKLETLLANLNSNVGNSIIYCSKYFSKLLLHHINTITKVSGSHASKMNIIDKLNKVLCNGNNKNIIILDPVDYDYAKFIKKISRIIILEQDYKFVLHKEALGYSYFNDREKIQIDIYEACS